MTILLLLLLIAAFFAVPPIAEEQLVQILESRTGGQVEMGKIRFNPITLRAEIEAFSLSEAGAAEPVITFESLVVDARWLGFLNSDAELDALILSGPMIRVEVDEQGEVNWVRLVAGLGATDDEEALAAAAAAGEEGGGTPLVLELEALQIEGGRILFRDRRRDPVFDLSIESLEFSARDLSTSAGQQGYYDLQLSMSETTRLSWTGSVSTQPFTSSGELRLENFDLRWVAAYLAEQLQFDLASGGLDLQTGYTLEMGESLSVALKEANVAVKSVSVLDPEKGEEFFGVENIVIGPIEARLDSRGLESLVIHDVRGRGGRLSTVRNKDETIRLVELLTPVGGADTSAEAEEEVEGLAPEIVVDRIRFEDFQILFEDRVPTSPATVDLNELQVEITGYSSVKVGSLALVVESRVGQDGRIKVVGPLKLAPFSGQLKVDLEQLALNDWASYLAGVAQLEIPEGVLGASLDVAVGDPSGAVSVSVQGRAQIDNLKTLDRGNSRKFVEWGSLRLEELAYSSEGVVLGEVALSNATARIVSDAQGRTNLDSIFTSSASASNRASTEGETKASGESGSADDPLKIRIDLITLDNVGFVFADLAPDPDFTIDLAALTGTIEGLSSESSSRAKVNLEGRIDDTAPVHVSGQINPLSGDAYTDVEIRVAGVSMPTFSPYFGRFAGYGIERGKLDLDLAYKLNANKLRAENRIELHDFSFGQSVKSDDATTLPLRLATEILRKPNGDIQLDIPLRGNLSDPSFNLLQLASKTFVNIITRIATSPFAIIGGLLPGQGETLSKVQFEAGSASLLPAEVDDLAVLAEVLVEKPSLRVEIRGRADPVADEPGLRKVLGSRDEIVDADWRMLARSRAKAVYDVLSAHAEIDAEHLFMVDVEIGQFAGEEGQIPTQLSLRVR